MDYHVGSRTYISPQVWGGSWLVRKRSLSDGMYFLPGTDPEEIERRNVPLTIRTINHIPIFRSFFSS